MSAVRVQRHAPRRVSAWWLPTVSVRAVDLAPAFVPSIALAAALFALGVGLLCLPATGFDGLALPTLSMLLGAQVVLLVHAMWTTRAWDGLLIVLIGCTLLAVAMLGALPLYFSALRFFAVIHRSVADAIVLLALSVPTISASVWYLYGRTPRASDFARYPLLLVPMGIGLGAYALLVGMLLDQAWTELARATRDGEPGWVVLLRPFQVRVTAPNVAHSGLWHNLVGSLELVLLTLLIAVPIGVGVGIFVSEIAPGWLGRVVRFCATALRGISAVLLALAAAGLVTVSRGGELERYIAGYFIEAPDIVRIGANWSRGSYIPAALVTALLIIPVVARATELGCISLPRGMREGSAALGATRDYALVRLVLPWAMPNILTATLLGAAETAGGLSTLLFIAGSGEQGVTPFNEVTSLSFAVFWSRFSPFKPFRDLEGPYQFTAAAVLLAVALTFTVLSLIVKNRYASRYGGA